jgi:hypothetical protein
MVHTVGKCDSLGTVGQWEDVTPPGGALASGSITQAFVVDPIHAGTVYLGWGHGGSTPTDKTGVWKTTDCGATWAHVSTGKNGKDIDSAGHWAMAIDFANPDVLYTANGYGTSGVFKSTNGGVDWQQMFPADIGSQFIDGGFIERITIDPTDHLHLIVSPHFSCTDGKSCLAETKDGGTTWRILRGTPDSGEDTGQMMIDSKVWLWGGTFMGLYRTSDGGGSWTQVGNGNSSDSLYVAKDGSYFVAHPFGVLHSKDSITWTVLPNSPGGRALIGDGTSVFTSNRNDSAKPYYSGSESNPTTWSAYGVSANVTKGGWIVGYDYDHHILYSSTESKGFWRVVTK